MLKNIKIVMNIVIAILLIPMLKKKIKNNVILIGGHEGQLYEDNSKALYEYFSENLNEKYEIYWIIDKDSPVRDKIHKKIIRGSIKNFLYYFLSIGLFYSHSESDVAPIIHRYISPKATRFHIAHGVYGLKKTKYMSGNKKKLKTMANLFVSVSDFEKNIKARELDVDESSIIVTGLPRFDKLYNSLLANQDEDNIILYMPTWREWYKNLSSDEFMKTDFYKNVVSLLTDEKVIQILKDNNFQLHLYLHFYFHKYIDTLNMNSDYIKILEPNIDVQEILIQSKILITDYSSVCWDFFYLNKPILFFQFDQNKYEEERGSYLDLDHELTGLKSNDLSQLIKDLDYTIQHYYTIDETFKKLRLKYFKYYDNQNCKRVVEEFEMYLNR